MKRFASVVKLADTRDLKSLARNSISVRVRSEAPAINDSGYNNMIRAFRTLPPLKIIAVMAQMQGISTSELINQMTAKEKRPNYHEPHQGNKECARRLKRLRKT